MKVRTLFGAAPTPLVDVHRLLVLHHTVTIHDTRFAHPHHKWEFVDEITPCAWFYADPQCRYTTVRRVRTTWSGAGIHFPSRRCYHVPAACTCILIRCPPLNVILSSRVIQAQTQNSLYPQYMSNYCVTKLRSTVHSGHLCALGLWSGYGRRKLSSLPNPLPMATLRRRLDH